MAGVLRQSGGTHQARVERETFSAMYRQQLAQFDAAENGLCFGRLEFDDGELRYIGRLGIHADTDDYAQLLMDWRADAARPFYLATVASPGDVRVRRHIKTRGRKISGLDDEVLDLATADPSRHDGLTGESALLAALNASRTGTMGDIVETIQAEQDVIIRAPMAGALVVQGGPGTGKTAVALHRAAYLLYTYRRQLEKRGVLVVGPNATFLRYIGQVLPSLGETSVLLSTIGDLLPGVSATGSEPERSQRSRAGSTWPGSSRRPSGIARKCRMSHWRSALTPPGCGSWRLRPAMIRRASSPPTRVGCGLLRGRSPRPGNALVAPAARTTRRGPSLQGRSSAPLPGSSTARIGTDVRTGANLLDQQDLNDLRRELRTDPAVRAAISTLWPILTPQQLVSELLSDPDRLAAAAPRHVGRRSRRPASRGGRAVDSGRRAAARRGSRDAGRGRPGDPRGRGQAPTAGRRRTPRACWTSSAVTTKTTRRS